MDTQNIAETKARALVACKQVFDDLGIHTFQAYLRLAYGFQPDELTRKRILNSPASILLHIRDDNALEFGSPYSFWVRQIELRGGVCQFREVELSRLTG